MPAVTIYVDDETFVRVAQKAKQKGVTTTQFIVSVLKELVAHNGGNGDDGEKVVE